MSYKLLFLRHIKQKIGLLHQAGSKNKNASSGEAIDFTYFLYTLQQLASLKKFLAEVVTLVRNIFKIYVVDCGRCAVRKDIFCCGVTISAGKRF